MRIVTIGGGPAGLYFSLLMKKADPRHEITVLERNAPDATFGWGVVFSEETLGALRDADRESYDRINDSFATWSAIDVRYRGELVRSRGHAFSAIARKRLLAILQERCRELGVEVRFHQEVADPSAVSEGADLVVGADGVNSTIRGLHADVLRPGLHAHSTRFAWFGTDVAFKAFTFVFRESDHGLFQAHAYPFDAATSTFIVECPEETWRRAGLDQASEEESIGYCEKLFAEDLAGHSLMSNRSVWTGFVTLSCETWHDRNVVLLGDAAHTAHFTIGSGTKLAMEDAAFLAGALVRRNDLKAALTEFEMERQPLVERFQQAALESAAYFENVRRYAAFEPVQFAFNLLTRSGRIGHLNLELRDPAFVRRVDGWFWGRAGKPGEAAPAGTTPPSKAIALDKAIAPPPMFAPFDLGPVRVPNRVVLSQRALAASDGAPSREDRESLEAAAASGAGLILTDVLAVSEEGRITPGSPGLYRDGHVEGWAAVVRDLHAGRNARVGATIGHAGRRGATRSRDRGVDRPLRDGGWPLVSASAIPYTRRSRVPREATREDMARIIEEFRLAAARASEAGFDVLVVDVSRGYLLASFLSPLTNRRSDGYGGDLDGRMRYPLEVFEAVRDAWPADRALAVRLSATDRVPGAYDVVDAVAVARALHSRGCDLVEVAAGQSVEHERPEFGRVYLVPSSDRIRNEAGVPTLVGGNLATADEMNTVLAAGRADLCVFSPPPDR